MPDARHRGPGAPSEPAPDNRLRMLVSGLAAVCLVAGLVVAVALTERRGAQPTSATSGAVSAAARAEAATMGAKAGRIGRKAARKAAKRAKVVQVRKERARKERERKRKARIAARKARLAGQGPPFTVKIGTFNVLGSQHTGPSGPRPRFPAASVRSRQAADYIARHGVDILGTQELQDDQLRALQSMTGMAAYPGFEWGVPETDNSILWDPGVFELVSADRYTITFVGRPRPQPIVRLKHRETGQDVYVVNTHPSPGGGRALTERRNGQAATVDVVQGLKAEGLPILLTGDMNDRQEFYCHVVGPAGMTTPQGGSYSGGCSPPGGHLAVDWVAGTGVEWSDYWMDQTPVQRLVSDHFFVSATAHVK